MEKDYKITREKFFDLQERKAIMKTCESFAIADLAKGNTTWPIRYMLVHLALNSGLRVSEIAALKIADLVFSKKEPYLTVRNGDGDKKRDVYIDRKLTKHLQAFIHQKRNWNQSVEPEAPLFSGQGGRHSTTTTLYISFKQAVRKAGLRDDLSIHSARHSYATLLYYKTKDLREVKKQLGHSSLDMTSLYADIMPEEQSRLANKILDD